MPEHQVDFGDPVWKGIYPAYSLSPIYKLEHSYIKKSAKIDRATLEYGRIFLEVFCDDGINFYHSYNSGNCPSLR